MTTATNFFTKLVNVGIRPQEATILETQFQNEPEFTEGLEVVATWVSLKQIPPVAKPKGQPWLDIYDGMLESTQAGIDLDSAYVDSLKPFTLSTDVQMALSHAISVRMKAILDFEQTKGSKKHFKSHDFINQLQQFGYKFKFNEVTGKIEINGVPLVDGLSATIRTQLRDAGMRQTKEAEDAYLAHAWNNRYHPIKEYLESLPGYDGVDYYQQLIDCFDNPDGLLKTWLRKWMLAAITKVYQKINSPMLVLEGTQRLGKDKFAGWLCSGVEDYFISANINPDSNDDMLRLADKWIWAISELGGTTRRADREALKAFLTREVITARRPYDRYDENRKVLANFMGSVNDENGFLNDPTGSRRFLVCHIEEIKWEDYLKIDVNKLWSQLYTEYQAGASWELSQAEFELSEKYNRENYEMPNPLEDFLITTYKIDPSDTTWFETAISVREEVKRNADYKYHSEKGLEMEIGGILKRLGAKKGRIAINGVQYRVYFCIHK